MEQTTEKEKDKGIWQLVKKAILFIIVTAMGLVAAFLGLIIVSAVYFWAVNGFRESLYIILSGLLFLVVLGLSVAIYEIDKKFQVLEPRNKFTRADLKTLGYLTVALVGEVAFFSAVDSYFKLFPATISRTLTMEILRTLIQTNGFLIGFSGIVFAQMFWAIHNQQSAIQMEILKASTAEKSAQTSQETSDDIRKDTLKILERKRTLMIIFMLVVMNVFVISILLSLSSMSQTETLEAIPIDPYVRNPFFSMTVAIVIFALFIAQSKTSVSEEDIEEMREKAKKGKKQG